MLHFDNVQHKSFSCQGSIKNRQKTNQNIFKSLKNDNKMTISSYFWPFCHKKYAKVCLCAIAQRTTEKGLHARTLLTCECAGTYACAILILQLTVSFQKIKCCKNFNNKNVLLKLTMSQILTLFYNTSPCLFTN